MSKLVVDVIGAQPSPHAAAPGITLRLRIEELAGGSVHAVLLRCQTRIEPRGRSYSAEERARLYELFGDDSQWDRTLRPLTWAHTSIAVPSFEGRIDIDLPIACTFDLEVASAKYLHAVRDGDIPLLLLFSGTIFGASEHGISLEPVSWDVEASYRMPARIWRDAMNQFFPGGGWIRLQQETIDRLQAFRARHAVLSWDKALDLILPEATEKEMA
jgi:hypothetical protein